MKLFLFILISVVMTLNVSADSRHHNYNSKHIKKYNEKRRLLKSPKIKLDKKSCVSPCDVVVKFQARDYSLRNKFVTYHFDPGDGNPEIATTSNEIQYKYIYIQDSKHKVGKDKSNHKHQRHKKEFKPSVYITYKDKKSKRKHAELKIEGRQNSAPNLLYTLTNNQINEGDSVAIDSSGSTDLEENISIYRAVIEGNTIENTTGIFDYTFSQFGSFDILLEVEDTLGLKASKTVTINVNAYPLAQFSLNPLTGTAPLSVNFDAIGSSDPDGVIVNYIWEISAGITLTGKNPSFDFLTEGIFDIKLTVVDVWGASNLVTKSITVLKPNKAPIAQFDYDPKIGNNPLTVNFNASASTDPDGDNITYLWEFSDGTTLNGVIVSKIFDSAGSHKAKLTVSDPYLGVASKEVAIIVNGISTFQIAASGYQDSSNSFHGEIEFLVENINLPGNIATVSWDMGDGTNYTDVFFLEHSYANIGDYSVRVEITDDLGSTISTSKTISIAAIKNPNDVESIYPVSLTGIELSKFNATNLDVSISVSSGGVFNNETTISLNDFDMTSNFSLSDDKTTYSGTINAIEGINSLVFKSLDQNNNFLSTNIDFIAGNNQTTITIKNSLGEPVSDFPILLKTKFDDIFNLNLTTNIDGTVLVKNLPITNLEISGISDVGYVYANNISSATSSINLVLEEVSVINAVDNSTFTSGTEGWDLQNSIGSITLLNGLKALQVETNSTDSSRISHTYTYKGLNRFLTHKVEFSAIDANHSVSLNIINHTKSVIHNYKKDTQEITSQNLTIYAEDNDVVTIEAITTLKSNATVFNRLFNYLSNQINAFAADGTIYFINGRTSLGHNISSSYLTDLNRALKTGDSLNLTKLVKLSVGNYPQGFNNIYGTFKIFAGAPAKFKIVRMTLHQGGLDMSDVIKQRFFQSGIPLEANSNGIGYKLDYHSRRDNKADYEQGSQLEDFQALFHLEDNNLSSSSDIEIQLQYNIEYDIGEPEIGVINFIIKQENLLIDHGAKDSHYGDDNASFPDNGDFWVTHFMQPIINSIANDTILQIGDASNVNGVSERSPRGYFTPHKGHTNGDKIDARSVNFRNSNNSFKAGAIEDVRGFTNQSWYIRNHLSLLGVTKEVDSDSLKLYKNSCINGKIVDDIFPKSDFPGHKDHYHFNFNKTSGSGVFSSPNYLNRYARYAGTYLDDQNGRRIVYRFSNLTALAGDKYLIQLYKADQSGKFTELIRKYNDENFKGLPYTGIPGIEIKANENNPNEMIIVVKNNTIDTKKLDKEYFFRVSMVSGDKCRDEKILFSHIFGSFLGGLTPNVSLLSRRNAGVDVRIEAPFAFDSIKLLKYTRNNDLYAETASIEGTYSAGETHAEYQTIDEVIANNKNVSQGTRLRFEADIPSALDHTYIEVEACLLNFCKRSGIRNFSRINFVLLPQTSLVKTAWIAPDTPFKIKSKLTASFNYNDVITGASLGCSVTDELQGLSFGVNLMTGGIYRASRVGGPGAGGFYHYDVFFTCNLIGTPSPGFKLQGRGGSFSGTSKVSIEESPLLASEVDRNFGSFSHSATDSDWCPECVD